MIEQVELRSIRIEDATQLAGLYAAQRAFLAPFDPIRADSFYTVDGQRADIEQALAHGAAGLRYRYVIVGDGRMVGSLGISNVVRVPHFSSANLCFRIIERDGAAKTALWKIQARASQRTATRGRLGRGRKADSQDCFAFS